MRRIAFLAAAAATIIGTSQVSAASSSSYAAKVDADGVHGSVDITLDAARTAGTIAWRLDGLKDGSVTVRIAGGTCEDPTDWVATSWTRGATFPDGEGARTHDLLPVSARAFARDWSDREGVTATVRNNGELIACVKLDDAP